MKKPIKSGSIVVVQHGLAFGHNSKSVTKVLSRPGAQGDWMTIQVGERYGHIDTEYILCEDMTGNKTTVKYLHKPVLFEMICDLEPATEEEKKLYRKLKNRKHE